MWDAWGGDAGFAWSKGIVERVNRLEKHLAGQHDQTTHGGGGAKAYKSIDDVIADVQNLAKDRIAARGGKNISDVGDDLHLAIALKLGLEGKPEVVESIADLDGEPMYRGLSYNYAGKEAQTMAEEYAFADTPRIGVGGYGSGTYFAATEEFTREYSYDGVTLVAGWKKGAKVFDFPSEDSLINKARAIKDDALIRAIQNNPDSSTADYEAFSGVRQFHSDWLPIQMMLDGYDGYTLPYPDDNNTKVTVVLNREALQVVNPTR
jgi:hypothetical protein